MSFASGAFKPSPKDATQNTWLNAGDGWKIKPRRPRISGHFQTPGAFKPALGKMGEVCKVLCVAATASRAGAVLRWHMRRGSGRALRVAPDGCADWHTVRVIAGSCEEALAQLVAKWRASVRQSLAPGGQVPRPRFALLFVPACWAEHLSDLTNHLVLEMRWPKFAPLICTITDSSAFILCTSFTSDAEQAKKATPRVFFLGKSELDDISVLSLNPELRNTNTMKINGTVLAVQAYLQREPQDVGGFLLFGDQAGGSRIIHRALSVLDVAYPHATKGGLVVKRCGSYEPFVVGYKGKVSCRGGGLLGLALPNSLHTAIGFCGCRPIGMPLEVHDASLQPGCFIRTVGTAEWDTNSWGVPGVVQSEETSMPPRKRSIPAAHALRQMSHTVGFGDETDVWIGVPRRPRYDEKNFRVAPGAGEWSLYRWVGSSAEGSVVLEGEGPLGDGLGVKGLRRIQGFVSQPDFGAIGGLARS